MIEIIIVVLVWVGLVLWSDISTYLDLQRRLKEQKEKKVPMHHEMMEELETYPVECGSACGHYDFLNQYCWLSWRNKEEG